MINQKYLIIWSTIKVYYKERDLPFDCNGSCSLLFYYFHGYRGVYVTCKI